MANHENRGLATVLFLGLFAGLVVSGTAYFCAWYELRHFDYFFFAQDFTIRDLARLKEGIERQRNATGRLPPELADLEVAKKEGVRSDETNRLVDAWSHPFQYEVNGDTYLLYSYGRDGQPGGDGIDADIYSDDREFSRRYLTLLQFTKARDIRGIQVSCVLAGLIAFFVCWLQGKTLPGGRTTIGRQMASYFLTLLFCLIAALAMCAFHTMFLNGH